MLGHCWKVGSIRHSSAFSIQLSVTALDASVSHQRKEPKKIHHQQIESLPVEWVRNAMVDGHCPNMIAQSINFQQAALSHNSDPVSIQF
jgi:hypothetical protein